ncbi:MULTISPECIES: helix-turn-helix domain-containing protein [unclassified Variovorax]|uniref:helix-turn-helix domain-containing protein n=1 Tax=unclassified Variovorax TaxID=663243 RepID=UPI003F445896
MLTSIDRFKDIHLHAASVRDWKQTYNQLSPGPLCSSLMQFSVGAFHVFREYINQRVVQQGGSPRGKVCFAVPLTLPGTACMQGRETDGNSIFPLRGGEEFMFHMPQGTDMLVLTFDADRVEQMFDRVGAAYTLSIVFKQPVLRVEPGKLGEFRAALMAVFCNAITTPHLYECADTARALEACLLDALLTLLSSTDCNPRNRLSSSPHSFIVEKCHNRTVSDMGRKPDVLDLCTQLRISRRTLQNSFRSVAHMTPVNYIRCLRLNGVRRQLMSTDVRTVTIADAAAGWGFTQLSHFASEYKELFGELPSQTRRDCIATGALKEWNHESPSDKASLREYA